MGAMEAATAIHPQRQVMAKRLNVIGTILYMLGLIAWHEWHHWDIGDRLNTDEYDLYVSVLTRFMAFSFIFFSFFMIEKNKENKRLVYFPAFLHQGVLFLVYGINLFLELMDISFKAGSLFDSLLKTTMVIKFANLGFLLCLVLYIYFSLKNWILRLLT